MTSNEPNSTNDSQPGMQSTPLRRVHLPRRWKPIANYLLMAFTVLMYFAQIFSLQSTGRDLPFLFLGKINELIYLGQYWRLITPLFLHGSIFHLGVNMYALYVIGSGLEVLYGHWRYLLLYFIAGFGGYALSFALSKNPALGASAGVFGLLAAQGVLVWQNRNFFGSRTRDILSNLVMILLINLMIGLTPGSRIDNYGHIGGFFAGGLFALLGGPYWTVKGKMDGMHIKDQRKKGEVILAAFLVLAGFAGVVLIALLKS